MIHKNISDRGSNELITTLLVLAAVLLPVHDRPRIGGVSVNLSMGDFVIFIILLVIIGTGSVYFVSEFAYLSMYVAYSLCVLVGLLTIGVIQLEGLLVGMDGLIKLIGGVAWFVATIQIFLRSPRYTSVFIRSTVVVAIGVSLIIIVQQLFFSVFRPSGPFVNPNLAAMYLLFNLGMVGIIFVRSRSTFRWLAAGVAPVYLLAIMYTQARAVLAAVAIGVLVTTLTFVVTDKQFRSTLRRFTFSSIIPLGILLVNLRPWIIGKIKSIFLSRTLGARPEMWTFSLDVFGNSIATSVFGVGYNQWNVLLPSTLPVEELHNTPLQVLTETGLIGFAIVLLMIAQLSRRVVNYRKDKEIVILAGYMVSMLAVGFFHNIENVRTLWIAVALLVAITSTHAHPSHH